MTIAPPNHGGCPYAWCLSCPKDTTHGVKVYNSILKCMNILYMLAYSQATNACDEYCKKGKAQHLNASNVLPNLP